MSASSSGSVVGFLNEIENKYPSAVFFAAGAPSSQFLSQLSLPIIEDALQTYLQQDKGISRNSASLGGVLQYGPTRGLINSIIAENLHTDSGIAVSGERVIVTAGCQEALDLCLSILCPEPSDTLLVNNPTYIGAIGTARMQGIHMEALDNGQGDLAGQIEALAATERKKGRSVRAAYLMPRFDNPTGHVLSTRDREAVVSTCAQLGIVILEDDAYGMYDYDGLTPPPLAAMDRNGCVIYLTTYSKTLAPSLRVGAATLPETLFGSRASREDLMRRLVDRKSLTTLNTSQLSQAIVGGMLIGQNMTLREWTAPARMTYRTNRDILLDQLDSNFSGLFDLVRWTRPSGGFFVGISLPFPMDLNDTLECARDYGVIVMPMRFFALDRSQDNVVRLAFSAISAQQVERGIHAFARYVAARMASQPHTQLMAAS